jgi:DNA-binding response OmpR family regulator
MNPDPGPRVLLLEDDPLAAWTGRKILEQMGCRVTGADCCAAAMDAWLANAFDLIIADHRLPDGFGVEMIARMRAAGRTTPVICLTAESEVIAETQRQELQIGAVVGKPINLETLRTAIHRCAGPSEPAAAAPPPATARRTIGHYDIFPCAANLTLAELQRIRQEAANQTWIALDLSRTTQIAPEMLPFLLEMAAALQRTGGRLSLAGAGEALTAQLHAWNLGRQVDILRDLDSLESLSRHPTSPCERAALMDSIVL